MTTKKSAAVSDSFVSFCSTFTPLEKPETLPLLTDNRTGAIYCECHLKADKLIELCATDAPLDQDEPEYRANRELVTNADAFAAMKADALARRSFSNIVAEYISEDEQPLKIIGGQHRVEAIRGALEAGKNELHGVKVYFNLTTDQRVDVQLISNTNIAISADLIDRMQETAKGPELRRWCQEVGLLPENTDFADKHARGGPISVLHARTFISNFLAGKKLDLTKFEVTETTPQLARAEDWEAIRSTPGLWDNAELKTAASQYAALMSAQRAAFAGTKPKRPDFPEKTANAAILAAWAYVAGALQTNPKRLQRHYDLANTAGKDPLNAQALAIAKHKTDPENYRGLGYRTDAKERGRLVELFYLQAESGKGINKPTIDAAILQYHAKQAALEALKAKAKVAGV